MPTYGNMNLNRPEFKPTPVWLRRVVGDTIKYEPTEVMGMLVGDVFVLID